MSMESIVSMLRLVTGRSGKSGFGSASTAEDVTHGIDVTNLTASITGLIFISLSFNLFCFIFDKVMNCDLEKKEEKKWRARIVISLY